MLSKNKNKNMTQILKYENNNLGMKNMSKI